MGRMVDDCDYELIWVWVCVTTAPAIAALLLLFWDELRGIINDWRIRRRNGF